MLRITDSGVGMDSETLRTLFEPRGWKQRRPTPSCDPDAPKAQSTEVDREHANASPSSDAESADDAKQPQMEMPIKKDADMGSGAGLGISICKQLVGLMKGELAVRSSAGEIGRAHV